MKSRLRVISLSWSLGLGTALAILALSAGPGVAQETIEMSCGTVTAYTAPAPNAAGSIRLGTRTFVLAAGSRRGDTGPTPISVGTNLCVNGQRDAAGAFVGNWLISPLGHDFCGQVLAFTPATPTAAGTIRIEVHVLPVAAGLMLTQAQVTGGQCFALGVNAQGDPQVVAHSGPWSGPPAGAGAPAATTRPVPATLPNTTTLPQPERVALPLGLVGIGAAMVTLVLLRVSRRSRFR